MGIMFEFGYLVEFDTVFGSKIYITPRDVLGLESKDQHTAIITQRVTYLVNHSAEDVMRKLGLEIKKDA